MPVLIGGGWFKCAGTKLQDWQFFWTLLQVQISNLFPRWRLIKPPLRASLKLSWELIAHMCNSVSCQWLHCTLCYKRRVHIQIVEYWVLKDAFSGCARASAVCYVWLLTYYWLLFSVAVVASNISFMLYSQGAIKPKFVHLHILLGRAAPPQDALTATAATILSLHYLSCQATMQCNGFVHLCFCDQMHLVFSHYVINMQIIKTPRSSLFSHYWRYWQL